ncbi:hypothetical protein EKO04_011588 [Ascochyta lentis]|uniref:Uncharacterized protein n=1 Tax=Ascochyta lentis TaxID=205686 RepID=A0A8H7ITL8_9PLEO|nr:hypothetical protein EKO04_011588 [Ascochyta lentis]
MQYFRLDSLVPFIVPAPTPVDEQHHKNKLEAAELIEILLQLRAQQDVANDDIHEEVHVNGQEPAANKAAETLHGGARKITEKLIELNVDAKEE